jgi:hypothetical protein
VPKLGARLWASIADSREMLARLLRYLQTRGNRAPESGATPDPVPAKSEPKPAQSEPAPGPAPGIPPYPSRASTADLLPGRARDRWRRRAALLLVLVSIATSAAAAWGVSRTGDEPPDQYPSMVLLLDPAPAASAVAPEVSVSMTTHVGWFGCGKVAIDAAFRPSDEYLNDLRRRDGTVRFALGLRGDIAKEDDLTITLDDRPFNVFHDASGAPTGRRYPDAVLQSDVTFDSRPHESFGATTPTRYVGYAGSVRHWAIHRAELRVRFNADWSRLEQSGTCAVSTPELVDTFYATVEAREALDPALSPGLKAFASSASVWVYTGRDRIVEDTGSPRRQFRSGYRRFCNAAAVDNGSATPNDRCGTLLFVSKPAAATVRPLAIFGAGALLSLGLQILWEEVLRPRRPRRPRSPTHHAQAR